MHLKPAMLFGFVIWAAMFALVSLLHGFGVYGVYWIQFFVVVAYGVLPLPFGLVLIGFFRKIFVIINFVNS